MTPATVESSANEDDGIINTKPGAAVLWDTSYLSSLKESFQVSQQLQPVGSGSDSDKDVSPIETTTPAGTPAETIDPTEVVDPPLTEVELPGGVGPDGGEAPLTDIEIPDGGAGGDPPLTDIEIPLTDIDVPSQGPDFVKPPAVDETNTKLLL